MLIMHPLEQKYLYIDKIVVRLLLARVLILIDEMSWYSLVWDGMETYIHTYTNAKRLL